MKNMNRHEWMEVLGLAPADIILWISALCIVGMRFINDPKKDSILAASALVLSLISCFKGMKRDDRLSEMTNKIKKISYPLFLLLVIIFIIINFLKWNS